MAAQMDVDAVPFIRLYEQQIDAMEQQFGQYIKDLKRQSVLGGMGPMVPVPKLSDMLAKPIIEITSRGFPVVPEISWEKILGKELENLMRSYLNHHYSMCVYGTTTAAHDCVRTCIRWSDTPHAL
jgi:hypothetical protein